MWQPVNEPWRDVVRLTLSLALETGTGFLKQDINPRIGFVRGAMVKVSRDDYGQLWAERDGESVQIDAYDLR